jgi:hypothetical protein
MVAAAFLRLCPTTPRAPTSTAMLKIDQPDKRVAASEACPIRPEYSNFLAGNRLRAPTLTESLSFSLLKLFIKSLSDYKDFKHFMLSRFLSLNTSCL